jgi:hypothetical protein
MDITEPVDGSAVHVSELTDEHAIKLMDMTLPILRRGEGIGLDRAEWKERIKAYCECNELNYAAALALLLRGLEKGDCTELSMTDEEGS